MRLCHYFDDVTHLIGAPQTGVCIPPEAAAILFHNAHHILLCSVSGFDLLYGWPLWEKSSMF